MSYLRTSRCYASKSLGHFKIFPVTQNVSKISVCFYCKQGSQHRVVAMVNKFLKREFNIKVTYHVFLLSMGFILTTVLIVRRFVYYTNPLCTGIAVREGEREIAALNRHFYHILGFAPIPPI